MSKNDPVAGAAVGAVRTKAVADLIEKIKDSSPDVRTKAWLGAGEAGWPAVSSLAEVMTDENLEVARAAKRALWKIVRHAGRPGADQERQSVAVHLSSLLADDRPVAVRREALWMLSEIGEKELIKPIAGLLTNKELREDARMVLERIGDKASVAALEAGFKTAPEDFKLNLAQSIRKRGKKVRGYECVKLVPTKQTAVKTLPK
ncbi:MAG: HEAT repeat domain-containing protein [Sedimentisphaerales bacterium]|nr:HEAT repeat domain-containing protein [Sedimentisphaerales bacterium]